MKATAVAHSNLALVKYWGKKNSALNIPAVGSISITLNELSTQTTVQFDPELDADILVLNNSRSDQAKERRVSEFLDLVRDLAKIDCSAKIVSQNNYPTGAGLASSASGFAALALAATKAAQVPLRPHQLSALARQGSGSAARSIFGGFAEMKVGAKKNGSDSYAVQLEDESFWPLNVIIAITAEHEKQIGSTEGMTLAALTSPYYKDWITSSKQDLGEMRTAIRQKDFERLGEISEHNCLKMHALTMSAKPGLIYWNQTTVALIQTVRDLRKKGIQCYFTIDAGPQVKIICLPQTVKEIEKYLGKIEGLKKIINTSLGPSAKLLETEK